MAVNGSREIVIAAPRERIIDVIADVDSLPTWSPIYKSVTVLSRHDDGRPNRVEAKVSLAGISDTVVLDYTFTENTAGWTLVSASQQRAQEATYTFTDHDTGTHVSFEFSVDLVVPVPGFILKRGIKAILDNATEGLRDQATA